VRVLFCGLGGIGQRHLRNLRALLGEQLEVHAYRVRRQTVKLRDNLTVETGADLEADYGVTVHTDLDAALAVKPQAVFICNPSSLHTPVALAAAQAGAHLFLEKPVADSMQGLDRLVELVDEKRLVCHVGYQFRFHPALNHLKSLVDSGFFGRILTVHAEIGEYLPNWHKYEDYRQMYAARADLGGGVILSQIHEMDLIYWYFGLPGTITCSGGKLSSLEIDVEDTATSLMTFDGAAGRFGLTLHQDFVQQPPTRTFKIVGDRGIAVMDLLTNRLSVYGKDGSSCEVPDWTGFQRNEMFVAQMRHFLDCVNGNAQPCVDLRAGIESLRMALAAKRSLAGGGTIRMNEQERV
jgi:predicted dehydrogenase